MATLRTTHFMLLLGLLLPACGSPASDDVSDRYISGSKGDSPNTIFAVTTQNSTLHQLAANTSGIYAVHTQYDESVFSSLVKFDQGHARIIHRGEANDIWQELVAADNALYWLSSPTARCKMLWTAGPDGSDAHALAQLCASDSASDIVLKLVADNSGVYWYSERDRALNFLPFGGTEWRRISDADPRYVGTGWNCSTLHLALTDTSVFMSVRCDFVWPAKLIEFKRATGDHAVVREDLDPEGALAASPARLAFYTHDPATGKFLWNVNVYIEENGSTSLWAIERGAADQFDTRTIAIEDTSAVYLPNLGAAGVTRVDLINTGATSAVEGLPSKADDAKYFSDLMVQQSVLIGMTMAITDSGDSYDVFAVNVFNEL